jgi:hypothetical protein
MQLVILLQILVTVCMHACMHADIMAESISLAIFRVCSSTEVCQCIKAQRMMIALGSASKASIIMPAGHP